MTTGGRSRWTFWRFVGLAVLLVVIVLLAGKAGPFRTLFEHFRPDSDGCTVYARLDFDQHKGNFRPIDYTQLNRVDDSCGGQALRLRRDRPDGSFGAVLPLHVEGAAGLKIAYLCKAHGVPSAMLNAWDRAADDNITPKRYQPLSAEHWTLVLYRVTDFRYNSASDLRSGLQPRVQIQNIMLYGEEPGCPDTWMLIDNLVVYRGDDRTPPSRVTGLRVEGSCLMWPPATDNIGVKGYEVARADGSDGDFQTIAETAAPSWQEAAAGEYRYRVRACDFEGNGGEWSEAIRATRRER